jgi:hypothetical protein
MTRRTFGHFHLTVASLQNTENMTKHALVSDIAKTFDVVFTLHYQGQNPAPASMGIEDWLG